MFAAIVRKHSRRLGPRRCLQHVFGYKVFRNWDWASRTPHWWSSSIDRVATNLNKCRIQFCLNDSAKDLFLFSLTQPFGLLIDKLAQFVKIDPVFLSNFSGVHFVIKLILFSFTYVLVVFIWLLNLASRLFWGKEIICHTVENVEKSIWIVPRMLWHLMVATYQRFLYRQMMLTSIRLRLSHCFFKFWFYKLFSLTFCKGHLVAFTRTRLSCFVLEWRTRMSFDRIIINLDIRYLFLT